MKEGLSFIKAFFSHESLKKRAPYRIVAAVVALVLLPLGCLAQDASDTKVAKTPTREESLSMRESIMATAKSLVGSPYIRGAVGPDKFDCSGLVYYCYQKAGRQVQRTVKALYKHAEPILQEELEAGDLVFFHTTGDGSVSHVGLYVANGQFISALSDGPNTGVVLSSLNEKYWNGRFIGGGRILPATGAVDLAKESKGNKTEESAPSGDSSGEKVNAYWAAVGSRAAQPKKKPLIEKFSLETNFLIDWQMFKSNDFIINWRGLEANVGIAFQDGVLGAAVSTGLRYNYGVDAVQIPLTLAFLFGECIRIYLGPIFSIGTGKYGMTHTTVSGTGDRSNAQIFPGILGIAFTTPSFGNDKVRARFIQDFNYIYYTRENGAPLRASKAAASGLTFSTGVLISIPFKTIKYSRAAK